MSKNTTYTASLGGEAHDFCLRASDLQALEFQLNGGIPAALQRFIGRQWKVHEIKTVLTYGLIGAGEYNARDAGSFVEEEVIPGNLDVCAQIATMTLGALIYGIKDGKLDIGEE
ncbi:GTA-gp10 family protein [Asticcacaulis sp. YBE204]|uniref:GTA-gp10 family protein n=1 Tax=Asticcacaulis sp. YBE204 TaxID=1282363 RepID=UPI0003C3B1EE|nr:GTA-gp10 family protein [Asticcacaulis sp. YBE204]ESQ76918.1 hypothetical protein AEYBE204_18755 [Asticcacaulis sp. YBE204]